MQGHILLKTVKGRRVLGLDFLFLDCFTPMTRSVSPAIDISVIGHDKSAERPCLMTSVETCVKNRSNEERHKLIRAAKSIRDRPVNANEHEERTFDKHLDHPFSPQVPRDEVGAPVQCNVFEESCCGCKP